MREMAGVEIDAEFRTIVNRIQRFARRDKIVCDFGGMHLQSEPRPFLLEHIHNRIPTPREILVSFFDLREIIWRERIEQVPNARAGETVDLMHAHFRGGARGSGWGRN